MRIYNGKDSSIDMPLSGNQNLFIDAKSVSGEFMANNNVLSMIATSFEESEIAIIVSGPYEINMCSNMPILTPMVVQSLDEAIERFAVKKEVEEGNTPAETPAPVEEEEELLEELEEEELPTEEVKEEVMEAVSEEEPKKEEKKQEFQGNKGGKKGK